ncbi:1-phosphatidylinositol phosphodiesterase-like [Cotesia typhae]|uniref:1-phosphatidylinositol phosphodiesterase-like n=1 Tax=Cotesia typhae TaxID=2053667 RepID=UPI003D68FC46
MQKVMWQLILLIFILFFNSWAESCHCNYKYKNYEDRSEFLSKLEDSHKLNRIALTGTHVSAAYSKSLLALLKTQELSIKEQLESGVRVLDIRTRHVSNKFALYYKSSDLGLTFDDVLNQTANFLSHHKREFVIMFMSEENLAESSTKSSCEIIDQYASGKNGWRLRKNWTLRDSIGMHRGRILLARGNYRFAECIVNLKKQCLIQNFRNSMWSFKNIDYKWREIQKLQAASFLANHECFINNMGGVYFESYPEETAKIGIMHFNGCSLPLNYRMACYFVNSYRGLIMVMADFPSQELNNRINDSNMNYTYDSCQEYLNNPIMN